MKKLIGLILAMACVLMLLPLAACSGDTAPAEPAQENTQTETPAEPASAEPIKAIFADADWDSIRFHNAVAMFIGAAAYNIVGEEITGTTPVTYNALKTGDIDVYMEIWSDNLPTYKEDLAAGAFQELSVNFGDDMQGFYVPRYVIEGDASRGVEALAPDLKSVADLTKYSSVFPEPDDPSKGRIYGAISGWAIDEVMRNKYDFYGLDKDFNYIDPGSGTALAASISAAYEKGEPIAAYYWEPTWIMGKYDMVLLEDAPYADDLFLKGECACPAVPVTVGVSNGFFEAAPDYCAFLSNYETSSALTSEALTYMQDQGASEADTAIWFLTQHDELLDQWLPADKAELVRAALAG
jgi:glycine betaine/proline transport system permease protein/glycine betaine/proline transport system substrate-binding protein